MQSDLRHADKGLVLLRVLFGALWLSSTNWKVPPDFGKGDNPGGLYAFTLEAVNHPVFGPYKFFVEEVVLPNFKFFGWVTLLTEAALGAFLLLGLATRMWALIGIGMSAAILLSVAHAPNEWPWSYYMMVVAHIVLLATAAGRAYGLDGVVLRGNKVTEHARAQTVLGAIAVVAGIGGLIVGRGKGFTTNQPGQIESAPFDLRFMTYNTLAALITLALGILAIVAAKKQLRSLGLAVAAVFALLTLQTIFQWSTTSGNFLGSSGTNLSFTMMLAAGIAVTATNGSFLARLRKAM